ncbi:MAG TPA: hypothetical protein VGM77_06175 [Gemmatimonadales bacterium]|jgi:hypothetical protein
MLLALCTALWSPLHSDSTLQGVVSRRNGGAPIIGALVRLLHARTQALTSPDGRFVIAIATYPDTLVTAAIGFVPDTEVIARRPDTPIAMVLADAPLVIADLVTTTGAAEQLVAGDATTWQVSGKATRVLPVAVEPDINRSLALVPGVSFSSLLSGRPMLRGLDAADAGYAIDGYEAINLYHAGRFFSAIPAPAIDHADLRFQPAGAELGGGTAGQINLIGRSGTSPASGDVQYGLAGFSGAASVGPAFVAARTVQATLTGIAAQFAHGTYDFWDSYANAHADVGAVPTSASLFLSSDRVLPANSSASDPSMRWSNVVTGVTSRFVRRPTLSLDGSVAFAQHDESSHDIDARSARVDVENHFASLTARLDARIVAGPMTFRVGASALYRDVLNEIAIDSNTSATSADRRFATNDTVQRLEPSAYVSAEWHRDHAVVSVGARVDATSAVAAVEPRLSLRLGDDDHWLSVSAGRSARLYHLVTDDRSEPKLAYYDIWLAAGTNGVPVATMDQLSLDVGTSIAGIHIRGGLFASHGNGEIDLVPDLTLPDSGSIFRIGQVRVAGGDLSAIAGRADGHWSLGASYTYMISQRNWGDGWVYWDNDRRHQARIFGTLSGGPRIRFSANLDLLSGVPYTPYVAWYSTAVTGTPLLHPISGAENSARGTGWLRLDVGLMKGFNGPAHSRWEAGLSVSNISVGDQAPRAATYRLFPFTLGSDPLFKLPPIPSIVLRGQFGAPH